VEGQLSVSKSSTAHRLFTPGIKMLLSFVFNTHSKKCWVVLTQFWVKYGQYLTLTCVRSTCCQPFVFFSPHLPLIRSTLHLERKDTVLYYHSSSYLNLTAIIYQCASADPSLYLYCVGLKIIEYIWKWSVSMTTDLRRISRVL